jgi:hypothetical protein
VSDRDRVRRMLTWIAWVLWLGVAALAVEATRHQLW